MKIVADLHLHSSYSRATSKELNFDTLTLWAKKKGINLLSSADFTHPAWFKETKDKLKDSGNGFFTYNGLNFMLGAEVSCIFSQGGKLRRIHLLLFAPSIKAVEKINTELGKRGKLAADGRPILGLSARTVLEIILEADSNSIMIPAHAWTPWFGVFGQNGGFDSLKECFGDLEDYIYAIETGLSSDPEMNWRVKELDNRSIVSFSDAHSAPKMGRELTIFETDLTYESLLLALKKQKIHSTIEFFPEEGKYHYNGHRSCNFKETPEQTFGRGMLCPVCKRPLTIGVMHRVAQLAEADRPEGFVAENRPRFKKLVPLLEIIAEANNVPVTSSKVKITFEHLVSNIGNELEILTNIDHQEVAKTAQNDLLGEALRRMREGNIFIDPGYDGVYGKVHIWPPKENEKIPEKLAVKKVKIEPKNQSENQLDLF